MSNILLAAPNPSFMGSEGAMAGFGECPAWIHRNEADLLMMRINSPGPEDG
ncbi:hypothetical protein KQ303_03675 [Synechococcus sp. CS-1333]|nr:hypothetical protein [Synechococcus sp. CS-1333]